MSKTTVPTPVYVQLERVRRSGLTNMLDRQAVQAIADLAGFYDLVVWIEADQKRYARALFSGLLPADDLTAAQRAELCSGLDDLGHLDF